MHSTLIVRRTLGVLEFLTHRGSAANLDDHLRTLADNDVFEQEASYSFTRFITWAIPILGFLGTVLGITGAISGVTPEVLEKSLSTVTDGLALAFDATALALALTMVTMFVSFLVERAEQGVLVLVDRYADRELAHRFDHSSAESSTFAQTLARQSEVLLGTVDQLVRRQADLWKESMGQVGRERQEAEVRLQDRLTSSIENALVRTLDAHTRRLADQERQSNQEQERIGRQLAELATLVRDTTKEHHQALAEITKGMASQLETIATLQAGEEHLRRLQETLNQNLHALAGAGAFEEALHSLTAAIHLVTAKVGPAVAGNTMRTRSAA
jgi:hypothetical protein